MVQYLLVGLIFYLIALVGNPSLRKSLREQSAPSIVAGGIFIILWFPILVLGILKRIKKWWEERSE
jgi:hypothetical protein